MLQQMRSILVIEDDANLRLVLEQMLTTAGYNVRTAVDGKQGATLCRATPPDLVITDIYMPNRDGLEVIMDLRQHCPKTRIIAISGQITTKNMLPAASTLGAARTLAKPFQPQELLAAVEEVLR
jgi:DNA-binding response OmpR family regulator